MSIQENVDVDAEPQVPVFEKEPAKKPPYMVVGDTFVAQADEDDGTPFEVRIRLRFKTKLIRTIRDAGDEVDQLFALLEGIGDRATAARLDEMDILDTTEFAVTFFAAWREKNGARLGEARRSSI